MRENRILDCIDLLRLDTLLNYLTVSERIAVNQYRNHKTNKLPKKAKYLYDYCKKHDIYLEFTYNLDKQLRVWDKKLHGERIIQNHPLYKAEVIVNLNYIKEIKPRKNV